MATPALTTQIQHRTPKGKFENEPFTDFSHGKHTNDMKAALSWVSDQLGREYPLVLGGERVRASATFTSVNPAKPAEVIGVHQAGGVTEANQAVEAALKSFESWKFAPLEERVSLLLRTAEIIKQRKFEFCAWLTYEVGKNWAEADADVAECIDFLDFYAREALRLAGSQTPIQFPGERDELKYIPLGVGAVIPPWNFPLAIMAGMTAAAIVTGNTVVVKPSPDAPTIAARFLDVLEEAGMPPGVVNLLQGDGPNCGNALVEHPKVRFIAFTGSRPVGLEIHEKAAKPRAGQIWIKRTILELGGKDATIVAADADVNAAVDGVIAAAFGFSGQKCSAGSRAIIEDSIYDVFVEKLRDGLEAISVSDPVTNPRMGPVINAAAHARVLRYIEAGKAEGRLVAGGHAVETESGGYYIEPTVFIDVDPKAKLAQEEIFGPVLAVMRVKSFDEALAVANGTEFGLTGAVYSTAPENLDRARREFHVGNLYLNRKCTGAMVGAHPFGGFNMSGTDSKAGGPEYLLHFTQAKTVAERLI
ncbi:L-glutamate gamma-semialdehyde dehydrogenase [Acidipila sp. EB88]|uniref:L-glutamate gamma-semialdehyde dehydrogenase n=1 Tax=Acidipila sp. EB88 TaxID=2305226 RepID=UPI000F5F4D5B|nr:L-glutamate gamma-semialdehyde dehydrogenase [Acidipila sp. EB88]RRA47861.1 L-glutamate gamma-semialdehyde dehydrogenase [Acidipila sp. EB88]